MERSRVRAGGCGRLCIGALILLAGALASRGVDAQERFIRGDMNHDGRLSITDAVCRLSIFFPIDGGACMASWDVNSNGSFEIDDSIRLLLSLFAGDGPLPAPFPDCGFDPHPAGTLPCRIKSPCESPVPGKPGYKLIVSTSSSVPESLPEEIAAGGIAGGAVEIPFQVFLIGGGDGPEQPNSYVRAWSFGIAATSETASPGLSGLTIEGTDASRAIRGGIEFLEPVGDAGAVSAVVTAFVEFSRLDTRTGATVLRGIVRAAVPAEGETVVMVSPVEGLKGSGLPVALDVYSLETDSYRPEPVPLTIRIRAVPRELHFIRGDSNQDGEIDISDPVHTLEYFFIAGPPPRCLEALDANDDDEIDISDAIFGLGCLFLGDRCPPPPFPSCGIDPRAASLGCNAGGVCL